MKVAEPKLTIENMTRKDFEALPHRGWNEGIEFTSLVILPMRKLHDSGFRCLDFVAVKTNVPVCRLSGCSDVIHIDGIGGYGHNWLEKYSGCPKAIPPTGWSIDCLPKSGLLRMWPMSNKMTCGSALSSFEIYALETQRKEEVR